VFPVCRLLRIAVATLSLALFFGSDLSVGLTELCRTHRWNSSPQLTPIPPPNFVNIATVLKARYAHLSDDEAGALAGVIVREARRANLDPQLILAVIQVESSGDRLAVSSVGAMGLMQLRPATAQAVASRLGIRWTGPEMLFDPVYNIRLGVTYLDSLVDRFGDIDIALAAYNLGPTRVARQLRRGNAISERYTQRVRGVYQTII
jgi:soluble lytic murein transglycosylase-like protein